MATELERIRDGIMDTAFVGGKAARDGASLRIIGVFDDASGVNGRISTLVGDTSLADAVVGGPLSFSVAPGLYALHVDLDYNLGPGRQGSWVAGGITVGGLSKASFATVLPPGEQFVPGSLSVVFDSSEGNPTCGVNLGADGNPVGTDTCIFAAFLTRIVA